jgi:hypothetical protein
LTAGLANRGRARLLPSLGGRLGRSLALPGNRLRGVLFDAIRAALGAAMTKPLVRDLQT